VLKYEAPAPRARGVRVGSAAELVELLAQRGVL